MAVNDLAPGFIRLFYNDSTLSHVQTIGINQPNLGSPSSASTVLDKGGLAQNWRTGLDAYLVFLQPLMHNSSAVTLAELWSKPTPTSTPVIFDFYTPTFSPTGGISARVGYEQITMSFRTTNGGVAYWKLFGSTDTTPGKYQNLNQASGLTTDEIGVRDYLISNSSIFFGRDNSYYAAPRNISHRLNDAIRRRLMRQGEI